MPDPLVVIDRLRDRPLHELLREGGVIGAGGAGFPAWPKYEKPLPFAVTNAQESEPGYYVDKWLHKTKARELSALYAWLLEWGVKIVVGAKMKDRDWLRPHEEACGATVLDCTGRNRHDLNEAEGRYLFCYTDDRYAFGKEGALLLVCAQVKVPPGERPTDHGFIVSNTETLWNIHRLLTEGAPVTHTWVHAYGETGRHTFAQAPVGTPVADVLEDAGTSVDEVKAKGFVCVDGGPGWYDKVDPATYVVTRRTNSILVIDPAFRDPDGKDVLEGRGKPGYPRRPAEEHQQSPGTVLTPQEVRVPLLDNPAFEVVRPARPVVAVGDVVSVGQVIAEADPEGISAHCHASIDGEVSALSEGHVHIAAR